MDISANVEYNSKYLLKNEDILCIEYICPQVDLLRLIFFDLNYLTKSLKNE